MPHRWPARQGGSHASAECVGVLAWVAPHPPPIVLVCPTGAAIAFGALVAEAGGSQRQRLLHPGTAIVIGLLFYEWLLWGICFLFCLLMHGGGGIDGQCVTYLNCTLTFPPSPPLCPALCLVQFLVYEQNILRIVEILQGKVPLG